MLLALTAGCAYGSLSLKRKRACPAQEELRGDRLLGLKVSDVLADCDDFTGAFCLMHSVTKMLQIKSVRLDASRSQMRLQFRLKNARLLRTKSSTVLLLTYLRRTRTACVRTACVSARLLFRVMAQIAQLMLGCLDAWSRESRKSLVLECT